jgi:ABC-type branched-chain amino acid transport systems, periplasmic component
MKRVLTVALVLVLAVLTAGAADLKVGVLTPLTGPVPSFGLSVKEGTLLAIQEWNAKGGVLGQKIVPVIEDGQCDPTAATNAANKLINQDQVKFILGEVCSGATIPVTEIAGAAKVLLLSPTATNPNVTVDKSGATKPYAFRACYIDPFQGGILAQFAFQRLKAKNAFIMYDQGNDYTIGLANAFESKYKAFGGTVVGKETYTKTDTDFSAILTKIKDSKAQVVLLPDYYNIVNLVTKQAKEKGINVPFIGGDGWDSDDLDVTATEGCYYTNHYSAGDPRPEVQNFLKAYGAAYKTDTGAAKVPDALAVLAYDGANLLFTAMKNASSTTDTAKVKASLEKISYNGVSGKITFDAAHNPVKALTILAIKGGKKLFDSVVQP